MATREIETIGRGSQVDPADGNHRQLGAPIGHGQHQSVPVERQLGEPARSGTRRSGSLTFGRRAVEIAPLHCDSASVDLLHLHHPEHSDNIPNLHLIFAATVVTAGRWLLMTTTTIGIDEGTVAASQEENSVETNETHCSAQAFALIFRGHLRKHHSSQSIAHRSSGDYSLNRPQTKNFGTTYSEPTTANTVPTIPARILLMIADLRLARKRRTHVEQDM